MTWRWAMQVVTRWQGGARWPIRVALSVLSLLGLLISLGTAQAGKAHEHGAGKLYIVQDGTGTYSLELELPLDSLVGFERPPRTAPERQAAEAAMARLRDPAALFRLPPAAGCAVHLKEVTVPVWAAAERGASATQPASAHADAHASFGVHCPSRATAQSLDLLLFDAFPRLKRLDVQAALTAGQRRFKLTPTQRRVDLGP
jgi:hypothetical protein